MRIAIYTYVVTHDGELPRISAGQIINGGELQAVMFDDGLKQLEKLKELIEKISSANDMHEVLDILDDHEHGA